MDTKTVAAIATVVSVIATVVLQIYNVPATVSCTVVRATAAAQAAAVHLAR